MVLRKVMLIICRVQNSLSKGCSSTFILLCIFLVRLVKDVSSSCPVHTCSADFVSDTDGMREGPYHPYCTRLEAYMKCIEGHARDCHGNLLFHGTKASVETLISNNDCENVLQQPPEANAQPIENQLEHSRKSSRDNDQCSFHGRSLPLAHCGLFGDPHLKTFNNTFQTCRVRGAWPMLSSTHLSIQVTNEQVGDDFKATATTKVTVLVKGFADCGIAKTYEASKEELPKAFVDGTTFSGADRNDPYVQVVEALPGQHIVIKVKKINSTVNVRKVGKYLTVSVTIPQEIVSNMHGDMDMQLCHSGCPDSEILKTGTSSFSVPTMLQSKAQSLCSEYNITDYYLDSCVFDLMTTGDETFRDAAYLALRDMWHNDPKASFLVLKNCTSWPCLWKATAGSRTNGPITILIFVVCVIRMLVLS